MRTIVIGGGISGLACAFRLQQLGLPVTLLEQADRAGGVIDSVAREGFLFELGPQSFLATPPLRELIGALGIEAELLIADSKSPRFVLLHGRLQAVPLAPGALLTSRLLGPVTKLRLMAEPLRRSRPPALDESVADFVRRKFGTELLKRLVGPMVSGIYAGDPAKLSLRSAFPDAHRWESEHGSLLRGAIKSLRHGPPRPALATFRQGNAALTRALAAKLGDSLRLGATAEAAQRGKANGKSQFQLSVSHHGRSELLSAEAVVIATPTLAAAALLAPTSPRLAELLQRIEYAAVAVIGCAYQRQQVAHPIQGFGFLVPRSEGLRLLGTVWNASLFPGRAPEGMTSMASFVGGATDPDAAGLPEEKISALVEKENAGVLSISGAPLVRVVRRYARALPQYNVGHGEIVAAMRSELARFPGLFLAGNYLEGPSIGACVELAWRTAEAVQHYLGGQS